MQYRWALGDNQKLPILAAELVRDRVTMIAVLGSTASALAAKAATATIPIVARVAINPVEAGLVSSLSHPGGNITGVTTLGVEVGPKQLELLQRVTPSARTMALLINPTNPVLAEAASHRVLGAASILGLEILIVKASQDSELEGVFVGLRERQVGGLLIGADTFLNRSNGHLATLSLRHGVPTISPYREFAETGGFMSYGGSIEDASRHVGIYAGRLLKGEKPATLPFQQSTKLSLTINLRTAKLLKLEIPPSLFALADDIIE